MHPTAKVIADSISPTGARITTFECEYWRAVHAEFMTHRMISKNAASSRAIPVEKQIGLIEENPAMPVHWGKNQPGMSAKEECETPVVLRTNVRDVMQPTREFSRENAWRVAGENAVTVAQAFKDAGYHKQIVNRLLEPFAHIKIVVTATEWDNFFYLRCHEDAQPDIAALAYAIRDARDNSTPVKLNPGEWHTPYFGDGYWAPNIKHSPQGVIEVDRYSLEDALAISASCCAQVSYRKNDDSLEKAQAVYKRLVESKPVHASPFEHQATPIVQYAAWPEGVTHVTRDGQYWSGNFRGWIQNRQLIPGHVFKGK